MDCPDCNGSGKYVGLREVEACTACGGSGRKRSDRVPALDLPEFYFGNFKRYYGNLQQINDRAFRSRPIDDLK